MSSRSGLRRTISAPPLPDANVDDYSAPARPRSRPRSASVSVAASTAGPSARPRPRAASFSEPAARVMFPARLYDVIQRAPPDVISWVADGSGFVVGDRERLVSEVLVAYVPARSRARALVPSLAAAAHPPAPQQVLQANKVRKL